MHYNLDLVAVRNGFDGRMFWAQARAGVIPGGDGRQPVVILTAQPALRSGSDVFFGLSEWRSTDLGKNWSGPVEHADTLGRRQESDGTIVAICDMTPRWHSATHTLLSTGHTVRYRDDKHPIIASSWETAYSAYDPDSRTWVPWQVVEMPDRPELANSGAGSTQRFDLEDGTILLPIYFAASGFCVGTPHM